MSLQGWTGKFSCYDKKSWSNPSLRAEVGYDPEIAGKHDDGIFWIRWEEVLLYFQNLQLSWNPALFSYRITTHSFWPKEQGPLDDTFNVGDNPQYIMCLSKEALAKKATIWILISRHVTAQEQEGCEVCSDVIDSYSIMFQFVSHLIFGLCTQGNRFLNYTFGQEFK